MEKVFKLGIPIVGLIIFLVWLLTRLIGVGPLHAAIRFELIHESELQAGKVRAEVSIRDESGLNSNAYILSSEIKELEGNLSVEESDLGVPLVELSYQLLELNTKLQAAFKSEIPTVVSVGGGVPYAGLEGDFEPGEYIYSGDSREGSWSKVD